VSADPRIAEEAALWADRLNRPAIDSALASEFDVWMRADVRHREAFAEQQALWDSETLTAALRTMDAASTPTFVPKASAGRRNAARHTVWKVGAMVASITAVLFILPQFSLQNYQTGPGEERQVRLGDGTRIDLSGNSQLRVTLSPWSRDASLTRGEAYFDVRHEARRAFRVKSGEASIRVLGTAFNVDRQAPDRTAVEVYRGAVEVGGADGGHLVLKTGGAANVLAGRISLRLGPTQARPEWESGWFEASDIPLGVLIDKIRRYAPQEIVATDPVLLNLPVSGRFHISNVDRALAAIESAYGVKVVRQHDQITLALR